MTSYAGMIATYAGDLSIPSTREQLAGEGWLVCDGASYLTSDYPDLFAALGTAYGGGEGHFNVPDLRSRFMRGVNGNAAFGSRTIDPDAASRTAASPGGASGNRVGSLQAAATALPNAPFRTNEAGEHQHSASGLGQQSYESWDGSTYTMGRNPWGSVIVDPAGSHSHTIEGGDATTAPPSIALYHVILAKQTASSEVSP